MTELPIPSGPLNREIIDRAYQIQGLAVGQLRFRAT